MKITNQTVRLDKYLANNGLASRRDVEKLLMHSNVQINGKQVREPGTHFTPAADSLTVNGKKIKAPTLIYFLLNKPKGVISTADDEQGRKTAVSLIVTKERIYPVGRLDSDTTGLLLLTNDGELTNKLTHPRYHIPKTYEATIRGTVSEGKLNRLRIGVSLEDGVTQPAQVQILKQFPEKTLLQIVLHEGRKRQIRRMCETVRLPLLELKRVSMGPLSLGNLKLGEYRLLTTQEVMKLKQAALSPDEEKSDKANS